MVADSQPQYLLPQNPGEDFFTCEQWANLGAIFHLTSRELALAVLLFEGKTRKAIAKMLGRSPGAIRDRIDQLYEKLNVQDRVGVVLRLVRGHHALVTKPNPRV